MVFSINGSFFFFRSIRNFTFFIRRRSLHSSLERGRCNKKLVCNQVEE